MGNSRNFDPPSFSLEKCPGLTRPKPTDDARVLLAKWAGEAMRCSDRHDVLVEHIYKRYPELKPTDGRHYEDINHLTGDDGKKR